MKPFAIVFATLAASATALTVAGTFTSLHPEEAYPDNATPLTAAGPFEDLLKQVQEKLRAHGFDAGTANGTFNSKTQAALAQFQLARGLTVSGALDDVTLRELGIEPPRAAAVTSQTAPSEAAPAKVAAEDPERTTQ